MRIDVRDERRRKIGWVEVDPAQRPTRAIVHPNGRGLRVPAIRLPKTDAEPDSKAPLTASPSPEDHRPRHTAEPGIAPPKEVFLNWDTALDDAGQLRRCVACGCPELFHEKAFPQVTAFVVILAFVGAVLGVLGLAENLPVLIAMAVVLVLDVAILVFTRRRLVCYRCRSTYRNLPIARYHRGWDRARADRYPPAPVEPSPHSPTAPMTTSTA